MVRKYIRKRTPNYDVATLRKAIQDVKEGLLNPYRAAKKYGIPRTTIVDRVYNRRGVKKDGPGRPKTIDSDLEKNLANGLKIMKKYGFGLTSKEMTELIGEPAKPQENSTTPFQVDANEFADEKSLEIKQEASGEENSYDSEPAAHTEKVFVQSVSYKKIEFEEEETGSKRTRFDSSESPLDYTEELYEFGKFVAEQLMCLDVEDARVAQAEIRALLSKFDANKKLRCMAEPSTSNVQPLHCTAEPGTWNVQLMTDDACPATHRYPVSAATKTLTNTQKTKTYTARPCKQAIKTASKINSDEPSTKSGSKVNTIGSLIHSGSRVNVAGPLEIQTKSLPMEATINVNPASTVLEYIMLPTVTGSTLGNTDDTEMQSGSPNMIFHETRIKIEPESESLISHVKVKPSVPLVFQNEPDSGDET